MRVVNRVFETMPYSLFLSGEELDSSAFAREGELARSRFAAGGHLGMCLITEGFI